MSDIKFPNGFESWWKTFHKSTSFIVGHNLGEVTRKVFRKSGHEGLQTLAFDWATEFEYLFKNVDWTKYNKENVLHEFLYYTDQGRGDIYTEDFIQLKLEQSNL